MKLIRDETRSAAESNNDESMAQASMKLKFILSYLSIVYAGDEKWLFSHLLWFYDVYLIASISINVIQK